MKTWSTGIIACLCILFAGVCADMSDQGNGMGNMYQQDSGVAEPFYPAYPPVIPQPNDGSVSDVVVQPNMDDSLTGAAVDQFTQNTGNYPFISAPGTQYDPSGVASRDSGTAEPFYPSTTPGSIHAENPVQITPVNQPDPEQDTPYITGPSVPVSDPVVNHDPVGNTYQDPGTAEPFYPSTPPSPGSASPDEPIQITPVEPQHPGYSEPYYPYHTPTPEPTPYYSPKTYSSPVYHGPRYYEPSQYYWYDDYYRPSYHEGDDWYWDHDGYYHVDGTLKIASTPHQAEIYVDNKFRGYTPYSGYRTLEDIRPGTYTIRLKYSGYYDYYEDIYVSRGRTVNIDADMVRIGESYIRSGSLFVQSEPSGASVYVDNEYRGFSPVTLSEIHAGSHAILIRKEGYADYQCNVQVSDSQTISISAVLTQERAPPEQPVQIVPTNTPAPQPTRSGLNGIILSIALVFAGIMVVRKRLP